MNTTPNQADHITAETLEAILQAPTVEALEDAVQSLPIDVTAFHSRMQAIEATEPRPSPVEARQAITEALQACALPKPPALVREHLPDFEAFGKVAFQTRLNPLASDDARGEASELTGRIRASRDATPVLRQAGAVASGQALRRKVGRMVGEPMRREKTPCISKTYGVHWRRHRQPCRNPA